MKIDIKTIKNDVENTLKTMAEQQVVDGRACFRVNSGGYIRLDTLQDDNCIVIEFAENKREVNNNRFEDGDLLSIEEYSEQEIVQILLDAINEY